MSAAWNSLSFLDILNKDAQYKNNMNIYHVHGSLYRVFKGGLQRRGDEAMIKNVPD